jgi:chemotaxis-related protein WspB
MLFIVFRLGDGRYLVQASQVVEVLPLVNLKCIPRAPAGVAGLFNYHGVPVPAIDLAELVLGYSSRKWMSTRIVLVNYIADAGKAHLLGLIAEQATETMHRVEGDFADSGVALANTPYLGAVANDAAGMVQRIEIQNVLPESIRSQLFVNR